MALTYTKCQLMNLRKQPVLHKIVGVCKQLGIFKFRGTRAGSHVKNTNYMCKNNNKLQPHQKTSSLTRQCSKDINLCLLNARSIRNKADELEQLTSQENASIVVITETWLNSTVPDEAFCPPDYRATRSDRNQQGRKGGGVCCLTHSEIQTHRIACHNSHVQGIDCCITWNRYDWMPRSISSIITWAIYIPPNQTIQATQDIREHIALTCDALSQKHRHAKLIIAGDFNNVNVNTVARGVGLQQIVHQPTRKDKILDQIWTDLGCNSLTILAPIAGSDHATVSARFGIHVDSDQIKEPQREKWMRRKRKGDVEACGEFLATTDWDFVKRGSDISQKSDRLKRFLIDATEHYFPKIRVPQKKPNHKPWVNDTLLKLFRDRTKAYKANDAARYDQLVTSIKSEMTEAKMQYYNDHVKGQKRSNLKEWHKLTTALGGFAKKKDPLTCNINPDELNHFFAGMGISSNPWVNEEIPPPLPVADTPCIEQYETSKLLREIDLSKTQPIGDISAFILKEFHVELAEPVTYLFNESLHGAVIPDEWCCFEIIPVPKIKTPREPQDWRPITISKTLFKLLDKYVANIFRAATDSSLNSNQYGGRPRRSTDHYLISLSEFIHSNVDAGRVVSIQTIDLAKAFNSTNHPILIRKTQLAPCHPLMLNWIRFLVLNMTQVVQDRRGGTLHQPIPTTCGVPQGTSTAPSLFNWFTNDAPSFDGIWSFIDDMTTGSEGEDSQISRRKSQEKLDMMTEWMFENCLTVNPCKCKSMTFEFKRNQQQLPLPPLTIAGKPIEEVETTKILGLSFQRNLKWDEQVQQLTKTANYHMYLVTRLAAYSIHNADLSLIYKSYVRSRMEYACAVWGQAITLKDKNKLERVQKRAAALIAKGWNHTYEDNLSTCSLTTLAERRDILARRMAKKLLADDQFKTLFPPRQSELSGINTRSSAKYATIAASTRRRQTSTIPSMVRLLNNENM